MVSVVRVLVDGSLYALGLGKNGFYYSVHCVGSVALVGKTGDNNNNNEYLSKCSYHLEAFIRNLNISTV